MLSIDDRLPIFMENYILIVYFTLQSMIFLIIFNNRSSCAQISYNLFLFIIFILLSS